MANLFDWFFRQLVIEGELDEAFENMEAAIHRLASDNGLAGVIAGGLIVENAPTPDLTVLADGPHVSYDRQGLRISYATPIIEIDMSLDELGFPTAVPTPGFERILSVFVKFERVLSDPQQDGNNEVVFFRRDEGFKLVVVQGDEAATPIPGAVPPALRPDHLLLADVTIVEGQTQIFDADIDLLGRREDMFVLPGSPLSVRRGLLHDVLQDLVDQANAIVPDEVITESVELARVVGGTPTLTVVGKWTSVEGDDALSIPLHEIRAGQTLTDVRVRVLGDATDSSTAIVVANSADNVQVPDLPGGTSTTGGGAGAEWLSLLTAPVVVGPDTFFTVQWSNDAGPGVTNLLELRSIQIIKQS